MFVERARRLDISLSARFNQLLNPQHSKCHEKQGLVLARYCIRKAFVARINHNEL